jgi:hypothetical protein
MYVLIIVVPISQTTKNVQDRSKSTNSSNLVPHTSIYFCRVLDHPMQKDFWTRLHRGLATIIRIVSEIFRIIIDKFSLIVSST